MLQFGNYDYLWILISLPILFFIYFIVANQIKKSQNKISETLWDRLTSEISRKKKHFKFIISVTALLFLIIAIANPLRGTKLEEVKQEGLDIFIALDVSLSMTAEDVAPNRIEKAKFEINKLIEKLSGDRIGLITFSGTSFVQLPLTIDYDAAKMFIDVLGVEAMPTPGSILEDAINLSAKSFYQDKPTSKVLIIITDGESTEGDAIKAAEEANKNGVIIYTIGVGTIAGTPIPVRNQYGSEDYKRDKDGNIVLTKLDEAGLIEIAKNGGGKYVNANTNIDALNEIFNEINKLQKREFGQKIFTEFETEYQYFCFAGFLLLVLEIFISDKKSKWFSKFNILKKLNNNQ
ncbi:MAG: VWA domain-containing protein [Bacteroidetes bacterium]|nr:VWA domain-containing protein [Bacteroidota bacterium]